MPKPNEVLRPRPGLVVDTIGKSSSSKVFEVHFDHLRYFMPEKLHDL